MITLLQIKRIHTLKSTLGLDADSYKKLLASFDVTSSKQLTAAEAEILIEVLSKKTDTKQYYHKKYDELKNRADDMATPAQLRKIEAVWNEICDPGSKELIEKKLRKFIKKYFHIDDVRFITKSKASIIISVLEKIKVNKCLKAV